MNEISSKIHSRRDKINKIKDFNKMDNKVRKIHAKMINKKHNSDKISLNDQSLLKPPHNSIKSLASRIILAHQIATMQNIRSDRNNFEMEFRLQTKIDLMGYQDSALPGQFAQSGVLIQSSQ